MSFSCLTFSASACPRPPQPIRMQMWAASGLPCLQSTQAEEAGVHRLLSFVPGFCCFSTSTTPPYLSPLWIQALSVSFSPLCRQVRSWLPALPPRVLSVAVVCCFLSLPVAALHARALSGARNAGETLPEFKCTFFFLSWNLSPFFVSQVLSVCPLLFFIYVLYLSVCPCCLLSLCCPLLRRQARANAVSFAASVHMLTVKFKRNELKLNSEIRGRQTQADNSVTLRYGFLTSPFEGINYASLVRWE